MYTPFPQEFTYVIAKTGGKKSDKSIKSQPDTANEVTDDNQEQIYTQIIAGNKCKNKTDTAMPSIVESLYDLTTAIDDTNNDMQQMNNNYEQIPFTKNPSYATKQQSTEIDTSVTEALDTSAVVDASPQQVVGNESLDTSNGHIYSKPFKKDNVIETTHNSEDSVVSIGIQNYTQLLSSCCENFNHNSHREINYSIRLCTDIISYGLILV